MQNTTLLGQKKNIKRPYTTVSVAYGWAGAVIQVKSPFRVFFICVTNGRTGRRTDHPTERVTYRVASTKNELFDERTDTV